MLTNKWTNPLSRSFQNIRADMIDALQSFKDKDGRQLITDVSEGNIFIILISLFAAIAEVLHYYIDNMARETFLTTARRYSSVVRHSLLVDYHPRLANAATVDVIITRELEGANSGAKIKIPKGTVFKDTLGNNWQTDKDIQWDNNNASIKIPLVQHELYTTSSLNDSLYKTGPIGLDNNLGDNKIEHNGVQLQLGTDNWIQVETFAYSSPTDKHFMVTSDEADNPILVFGDGKFGKKPDPNQKITLSFYITKGSAGNITKNSIVNVPSVISSLVPSATCNNPYSSGDGFDYENIEMLRSHAAMQARTMNMLVTRNDVLDVVRLVPGVKEAALEEIQGKALKVYVSPIEGNTPVSNILLDKVSDTLASKNMLANTIKVYPAGVSKIHLVVDITGKPSYKDSQIYQQTIQALLDKYSGNNVHLGGSVRISDIYALIDNLPSVDYLHITKFYVSPWPKIINGDTQLDLKINDIEEVKSPTQYIITIGQNNTFNIRSSEGGFSTDKEISNNIFIDDTINGVKFSMAIVGSYNPGSRYQIIIPMINSDYNEEGFNQIIFDDPTLLKTSIHETV